MAFCAFAAALGNKSLKVLCDVTGSDEELLLLASVFARCVCSECGTRPITAKLAQLMKDDCWFEKRVDFVGLEVIRPTRE